MDVSTFISSERSNDRRDNSSNCTSTSDSYAVYESQRNYQDDTDCLERLYQATDIILIICAVVIIVSVFVSLGISIFGLSKMILVIQWGSNNFVLSS